MAFDVVSPGSSKQYNNNNTSMSSMNNGDNQNGTERPAKRSSRKEGGGTTTSKEKAKKRGSRAGRDPPQSPMVESMGGTSEAFSPATRLYNGEESQDVSLTIGDVFGQSALDRTPPTEPKTARRPSTKSTGSKESKESKAASKTSKKSVKKKKTTMTTTTTKGEDKNADNAEDPPKEASTRKKTTTKSTSSSSGTKTKKTVASSGASKASSSGTKKKSTTGSKSKSRKSTSGSEPKNEALYELITNVNHAMEEMRNEETTAEDRQYASSAHRLLSSFEALLVVLVQMSDELELMSMFARNGDNAARVESLQALVGLAPPLDQLFSRLKPLLFSYLAEDAEAELDALFIRIEKVTELIAETAQKVHERQQWNVRAETIFVTLLEIMEQYTTELDCLFQDISMPPFSPSNRIKDAWSATGHVEELKTILASDDHWLFRQVCYEVMLSTDQWCPDKSTLMVVCEVDMPSAEHSVAQSEDTSLAPIPQGALQVLDKVNGDPLTRVDLFTSILRRILPTKALTDPSLMDSFSSMRSTIRNPRKASTMTMVAISSIPETQDDPKALGLAGVGKTTMAAMVASHPDVRRHFKDGVAWLYLGEKPLTYSRYTQCLRELVSQFMFYEGVPLFAELVHTPGEPKSKRRRREEGFMVYARDSIAELLQQRSVLIVLDNVCSEEDLEWFNFSPSTPPSPGHNVNDNSGSSSALVTTRVQGLLRDADTIEIDLLEDDDAIHLLAQESGHLPHTTMESPVARSVIQECANHPLSVKSVGRWLNLKHATAGRGTSPDQINDDVVQSLEIILDRVEQGEADMIYEIMNMSLSPAINGKPTNIIKFCFAAFVAVFCDSSYTSDFLSTEASPMIPMTTAELLFESLLELEEDVLFRDGSLFSAQKKEAAVLIPEALSALGVLKVITAFSDVSEDNSKADEHKYLQIMHLIQNEYGEYLRAESDELKELTRDSEKRWNRAFVQSYLAQNLEWDADYDDPGHDYALEMIVSHMIRAGMNTEAANLLADEHFVQGRILSLGRENATRRHVQDCEHLFSKLEASRGKGRQKLDARSSLKSAYQIIGRTLNSYEEDEKSADDQRLIAVDVGRAHFELGFSLAEKRCWDAAIAHWETSQELLVSSLGMVEFVAGILYNVGVVYSEMNEYEQALGSLKQCLRIRGALHGEEHILYAQTIQKIGDVFLAMSDYHEAMESYNWALDVMHIEPSQHRVDIGDILDNLGNIHYSKGEVDEALQNYQDALRSKQVELGEDHPELAVTYQHIGNCLSDKGDMEEAVAHFEEAIRLKEMDPDGGDERDAEILMIEGVLNNLYGKQDVGLQCYERSLQILVTKAPHKKEKIASLLHLIGCVYLMTGEHKKAMKLFEESLQARRKVLGFVHLDVASTLFNMAFLHQTRNRLEKALKCLEEALKIRQLRLPDSEKVAVTHEKIGTLARAIGKTKKAEIAFGEALRIRKVIHGEDHEAVATVLQELGDLMDDLGEYDEAMNCYVDALDIRRKRLGSDDVSVAETLYSMGFTLHNRDSPDRALQCFEESLNIRKFQLGEDSKEVGDTLNMMGFLLAKQGDVDDALGLLWDALRIRKLQNDHVKVSETLKNIGNVHREKQEHELAVECYEECLRIRRSELGNEHEKVADALIAIGNVRSDMEQAEPAMRAYQEALQIRTKVHGEHDERVASVLQYMGTLEFRTGDLDRARHLLNEFIRIRRENNTENDGDYVNVLFMIGNIHKMQGNESEARQCWSEAYNVFHELGLAETNPQIARVMDNLLKDDVGRGGGGGAGGGGGGGGSSGAKGKKGKGSGLLGNLADRLKGTVREEKLPNKGAGGTTSKKYGQLK